MIEVHYTLHHVDGDFDEAEARGEHVPRVGEPVTIVDHSRCYGVVDVLWHVSHGQHRSVTVTAVERNRHAHIRDVLTASRRRHEAEPD